MHIIKSKLYNDFIGQESSAKYHYSNTMFFDDEAEAQHYIDIICKSTGMPKYKIYYLPPDVTLGTNILAINSVAEKSILITTDNLSLGILIHELAHDAQLNHYSVFKRKQRSLIDWVDSNLDIFGVRRYKHLVGFKRPRLSKKDIFTHCVLIYFCNGYRNDRRIDDILNREGLWSKENVKVFKKIIKEGRKSK